MRARAPLITSRKPLHSTLVKYPLGHISRDSYSLTMLCLKASYICQCKVFLLHNRLTLSSNHSRIVTANLLIKETLTKWANPLIPLQLWEAGQAAQQSQISQEWGRHNQTCEADITKTCICRGLRCLHSLNQNSRRLLCIKIWSGRWEILMREGWHHGTQ